MLHQFQKIYECNVGANNTTIYGSYKIHHIDEMKMILNYIRKKFPESSINKRSNFSMINEWRSRNLLYALGIHPDRTKHVDLNTNNSIWMKIGYFIGSMIYFKI